MNESTIRPPSTINPFPSTSLPNCFLIYFIKLLSEKFYSHVKECNVNEGNENIISLTLYTKVGVPEFDPCILRIITNYETTNYQNIMKSK